MATLGPDGWEVDPIVSSGGVPPGGTAGQVLIKQSSTDGDVEWGNPPAGEGAVDSVNGQTGVVVLGAADVGAATSGHSHSDASGSASGFMSAANFSKLDGIATGATANSSDATLLDRANHTGSQAIGTVTGLQTALDGKQALTPTVTTDSDGARTLATGDEGDVIDFTNTASNAIAINTDFNGRACLITWPASAAAPVLTPTGVTLNGAGSAITGAPGPGCLAIFPNGTNAFRVVGSINAGVPRALTGAATFQASDLDVVTRFNSGSTAALEIPADATLGSIPGKSTITVFVQGAGVPTFTAGAGATISGSPRAGLAQNDFIVLAHTGIANTWAYV